LHGIEINLAIDGKPLLATWRMCFMIQRMRTTIRIDEDLLKQVKLLALESGKNVTAIIEDALQEKLARQGINHLRQPAHLVTFNGKGLQPGIVLDDSA
jgi:hypothetical protein